MKYLILLSALSGCCKKGIEYKIEGEWKRCAVLEEATCGLTLECGNQGYTCMTNLESRSRCNGKIIF